MIDCKIRAGKLCAWWGYALPMIPGWDMSGTIVDCGAGVTDWQIGDVVYALLDFSRDGAYAEYVVIDTAQIAEKPTTLNHTQAAALPLMGLTTWQALVDAAQLSANYCQYKSSYCS